MYLHEIMKGWIIGQQEMGQRVKGMKRGGESGRGRGEKFKKISSQWDHKPKPSLSYTAHLGPAWGIKDPPVSDKQAPDAGREWQ